MSPVQLLSANLAIAVLESFLYGIYVVLASFTLYLMVTRHLVTAHWTLNLVRLFLTFESSQGPRMFYSNLAHTTEVLKYGFLFVAWVIGDSFLIHRLWAVLAFHTRIVIFPIFMLLGVLVFGIGLTYQLSTYDSNDVEEKVGPLGDQVVSRSYWLMGRGVQPNRRLPEYKNRTSSDVEVKTLNLEEECRMWYIVVVRGPE
ncbi:hypothetical protein B0H10DRAFT_1947498 [Mycena sp. CBHHK59/15]|nr:hypothetical protein B0H10DRAFT_1947498 [Mycena sp. CBHHK59/15]